jgi:hypothetical protein
MPKFDALMQPEISVTPREFWDACESDELDVLYELVCEFYRHELEEEFGDEPVMVDDDVPDPTDLLDQLEYWLKAGNIQAALAAIEAFNHPAFGTIDQCQQQYDEAMQKGMELA